MRLLPEREPNVGQYERPDEISSLTIERKEVVTPIPSHFKAQVGDDKGNNLIQTPAKIKADIVIPDTSSAELELKSRGDIEDASVWSANYWLRIIKKALFFGWKVVFYR